MPEIVSKELWDAARILLFVWVASIAFGMAKSAAEKNGRLVALKNTALVCFAVATFAAFSLGSASCEDGDALYGNCEGTEDEGYSPTSEHRAATFLFWLAVLSVPAVAGTMNARKYEADPWRRPKPRQPSS